MKAIELVSIIQDKIECGELSEDSVVYLQDPYGEVHDIDYEILVDDEGDVALSEVG